MNASTTSIVCSVPWADFSDTMQCTQEQPQWCSTNSAVAPSVLNLGGGDQTPEKPGAPCRDDRRPRLLHQSPRCSQGGVVDSVDAFESAKSHLFDTSTWGPFCAVTLTLKQGRQTDCGPWIKIN